jgi:hypothetical protein
MSQPNSQPTSFTLFTNQKVVPTVRKINLVSPLGPLPGEYSTSRAFDTKEELFKMFGKKTFKKGMEFKNSQQVSRRLSKFFSI